MRFGQNIQSVNTQDLIILAQNEFSGDAWGRLMFPLNLSPSESRDSYLFN